VERAGRRVEHVECLRGAHGVALALSGQHQTSALALEQRTRQPFLETLDLSADSTMGDAELARGCDRAAEAYRRLKGAHRAQRRQLATRKPVTFAHSFGALLDCLAASRASPL